MVDAVQAGRGVVDYPGLYPIPPGTVLGNASGSTSLPVPIALTSLSVPITAGTTAVSGGTAGGVLWNNGGVVGVGPLITDTSGNINIPGNAQVPNVGTFSWANGSVGSSSDVVLFRDAAGVLAQRNGANAQAFRLYNTFTDASNYERVDIGWAANTFNILVGAAGTGLSRGINIGTNSGSTGSLGFQTGGTNRWQIVGSTGHLVAVADNTYDIGASGANRPRNLFVAGTGTFGGTISGTSLSMSGSINVGTAGAFFWGSRSLFRSPSDGVVTLSNNAETDFSRLQFGGTTSSFPALKRSGSTLQARLADDSAFADFNCGAVVGTSYVKSSSTTVAGLPSASGAGAGARSFVTDASAATFMSTVTGGGSNAVPVVSDGTNWKIG